MLITGLSKLPPDKLDFPKAVRKWKKKEHFTHCWLQCAHSPVSSCSTHSHCVTLSLISFASRFRFEVRLKSVAPGEIRNHSVNSKIDAATFIKLSSGFTSLAIHFVWGIFSIVRETLLYLVENPRKSLMKNLCKSQGSMERVVEWTAYRTGLISGTAHWFQPEVSCDKLSFFFKCILFKWSVYQNLELVVGAVLVVYIC